MLPCHLHFACASNVCRTAKTAPLNLNCSSQLSTTVYTPGQALLGSCFALHSDRTLNMSIIYAQSQLPSYVPAKLHFSRPGSSLVTRFCITKTYARQVAQTTVYKLCRGRTVKSHATQ